MTAAKRVGAFSIGASGGLCFHPDCDDLDDLCQRLNEGVTGGPYRAVWAWAGDAPAYTPLADEDVSKLYSAWDAKPGASHADLIRAAEAAVLARIRGVA